MASTILASSPASQRQTDIAVEPGGSATNAARSSTVISFGRQTSGRVESYFLFAGAETRYAALLGEKRADGGRGGETRRLNADGVQKARRALGLADNKIVLVLFHMRAKAGEARDRAVAGKRGDALSRPLHDALETRGGRVRRFGIFHIHSSRAHEEIAVDGRRHENALAHFGGQLEHGA